MKKHLFSLLLFSYSMFAFAQTTISGKISDKHAEPLPDIMVTLLSAQDSSVVAFSLSDANGGYEIRTNSKEPEFLLTISGFEIERQTKKIANRTQTVNFTAEAGGIVLREVTVNSQKIWGVKDTVNYLVSAFKDKKDVVIADVLRKMPGITVSESGQISYQGKPINKFYIEGMDMLGGRYGVATNNISAEDVSTVQVLENHQPIKALETTSINTTAAINLKIKENKKGIYTLRAVTGLGYDKELLWHGELIGMYFGRGYQNISTYKNDNTGENIGRELSSFYGGGGLGGLQMTSLLQPATPPLKLKRYYFNNSHTASVNNIKRLKNSNDLRFNITLDNSRSRREGYSNLIYSLPGDSSVTISEEIATWMRTTKIEGDLNYSVNNESNYLNNTLSLKSNWTDGNGEIITTIPVEQSFNNEYFSLSNNLQWIKKFDEDRGFQFSSVNAAMNQPHHLSISPDLYTDIFNISSSYNSLRQRVKTYGFSSGNAYSMLSALIIGRVRINPSVGLNFSHYGLKSDIDVFTDDDSYISEIASEFRNDITHSQLSTSLGIGIDYISEQVKIQLSMPVNFRHSEINQVYLQEKPIKRNKLYFNPALNMKYTISSYWDVNAVYNYGVSTTGLSNLYPGYILSNYMSINRYQAQLFDKYSHNGGLNVAYKNLFSMFFFNLAAGTKFENSDFIYGSSLHDKLFVSQIEEIPNSSRVFSINGNASKGFDWKKLTVNVGGGWNTGESPFLRQGELLKFQFENIKVESSIQVRPLDWLITSYSTQWGRSKNLIPGFATSIPIQQTMENRVEFSAELPLDLGLNLMYEHYYNSLLSANRNISFADVGFTYTRNGVLYSLDFTNIFDTRKYITSNYGIDTYYSEYKIRPRAVMLKVQFRLK